MFLLRIVISLGLILFLLRETSLAELWAVLGVGFDNWQFLVAALIIPGCGAALAVLRWRTLLVGAGANPSFRFLYEAFLVGAFFNHMMPSTIGGDIVRGWWVQRAIGSPVFSITIVGLDRLLGLLGFCAVGLAAASIRPALIREVPEFWLAAAIVALGALAVVIATHPPVAKRLHRILSVPLMARLHDKAAQVYRGFVVLRRAKMRILYALVISVALQSTIVLQYYVLSSAMNIPVSFWALAIVIPVVTMITWLPISINGFGVREGALAALGGTFGLATGDAIALAWLFVFITMLYGLIGGLIYLLGRKDMPPRIMETMTPVQTKEPSG